MKTRSLDREIVEAIGDDPELLSVAQAIVQLGYQRRRRRLRMTMACAGAMAFAAVAVVAFVLRGGAPSLSDQALAAIGDRGVLHVLLTRTIATDMTVDISTGRERAALRSVESWFQERPRRLHVVIRNNGYVLVDTVGGRHRGARLDPGVGLFLSGYRRALQIGKVRAGVIEQYKGRRIRWLTVVHGRPQERVAVDLQTYLPVLIETAGGTRWTVQSIGTVTERAANFRPTRLIAAHATRGSIISRRETTIHVAATALGWRPLWPGKAVAGFRRVGVAIEQIRTDVVGSRRQSRLEFGLALTYRGASGTIDIREATEPLIAYRFVDRLTFGFDPIPPRGAMQLTPAGVGTWIGQLQTHGVFVTILAPSPSAALAAARALRAVPRRA